MAKLRWELYSYSQLTVDLLYEILRLRTEVFVVEQECPYQEVDGKDSGSWHLMGYDGEQFVAYARLLPPGLHYHESSIGRVITALSHRGTGLGRVLMEKAIVTIPELFGEDTAIRIEAQSHLEDFYGSLGFVKKSEPYMLDGIPHIEMLLNTEFRIQNTK
jgi:ElaA protein